MMGMGFVSKCNFAPPAILLGLLLLPLDVGYYLFLVGSNIVLSAVVQQRVVILEFLKERMSTCPSLPSCRYTVVGEWSANHWTLREGPPPPFFPN